MKLLNNISDRDRRFIVPAIACAMFISILLLVDYPIYRYGADLRKKAGEEEKRLSSIISMGQNYISVKNQVEDVVERAFKGEGASLSGMDAVLNKAGLKKKLSFMKPTTAPVVDGIRRTKAELYIEKLSTTEISSLLSAIEADWHPMAVEKATLKVTYENPSLFNLTLLVNTVEKD